LPSDRAARLAAAYPRVDLPPGAPDPVVHINYNENPYGPSSRALQAIRQAPDALCGRYYADDTYEALSKALAAHHSVDRATIPFAGGSPETLNTCAALFLRARPRVVVAEPAYEAVLQYAANSAAAAIKVPLTRDYRHDLDAMAEALTA